MKVLVFGGSGFIGSKFIKTLLKSGKDVYFTYNSNKCSFSGATSYQLDITDKSSVENLIRKIKPELVIHTIAVSSIDLAETNKQLADKINVGGTKNIIEGCKKTNSKIVYISTSAVFDGSKETNLENQIPKPINYDGATHLQAEKLVQESGLHYLIFRTDYVYGWPEKWQNENAASKAIKKIDSEEPVTEVSDWYSTPTFVDNMVDVGLKLVEKEREGIYHVVGPDYVSRANLAAKIAELMKKSRELIQPVKSTEVKLPAKRAKAKLNNKKTEIDAKMALIGIEEGIRQMIRQKSL